jgi:hypothetical protein
LGLSKTGKTAGSPFLYATNFRTGNIDVFDWQFSAYSAEWVVHRSECAAWIRAFGIQNIAGNLWITYALQDKAKHDPVNKPAHGFVSVLDTDGNLIQHFTQHGHLSSPWGVAMAPASFGEFARDILVGNFGDGQINAYAPATGHWLGALSDADGNPIINPGLWTVTFSGPAGQTAVNADPDTLYITAGLEGPTHEPAGLFANSRRIHKKSGKEKHLLADTSPFCARRPWRNARRLFLKNSGVIPVALLKTRNKLRGSYLSYFVPDVAHTSPQISGRVLMTRETKITENVWIAVKVAPFLGFSPNRSEWIR